MVSFTNILRAAFLSIFFRQKIQTQTASKEKLSITHFYNIKAKMLMKLLQRLTIGIACNANDKQQIPHQP